VLFFRGEEEKPEKRISLETGGASVTAVSRNLPGEDVCLGLSDGSVMSLSVTFPVTYLEGDLRQVAAAASHGEKVPLGDSPVKDVSCRKGEEGEGIAALFHDGGAVYLRRQIEESLFGEAEVTESRHDLGALAEGASSVALDPFLKNLFIGKDDGAITQLKIRVDGEPAKADLLQVSDDKDSGVTSLAFLAGGRSLVVGTSAGDLSVWFSVPDEEAPAGRRMKQVHRLESHSASIASLAATGRNRCFLSGDETGEVRLHNATTEKTLLRLEEGGGPLVSLSFSPKADGIVAADEEGRSYNWSLSNPHPEVTIKTLFGKVWYEGYSGPEYVWQSTGLEDDFEPKLSLTPLTFGTFKGTLYAMLFAVPLSILSAVCVSQFMHPRIRDVIKPTLEIMAALPSVILGFLAGLWLAPVIQENVPAVFISLPVFLMLTMAALLLWRILPLEVRSRFREGTELLLLIPVFILGGYISYRLGLAFEALFLGGDFGAWVYGSLELTYDQRNSLIVGFAMGFAVIPIIFSISEDALSNVPRHLISGSLALGATRWQTALRVVLPTASPGIFSAVMIGLGRAVGETMIVLMATGNTPIMDWNLFNGFRALSANIAVEIPEAPHGGSLYRVLFLAAFLLFMLTFLINSAAEIVRMRLRKKYGQL
jgi:phosphate transport system permease protein